MGCAPSAATATTTSPRVSVADDKTVEAMAAESAAATDTRRSYTGVTDSRTNKTTRVNGDLPLTRASLSRAVYEPTNKADIKVLFGIG